MGIFNSDYGYGSSPEEIRRAQNLAMIYGGLSLLGSAPQGNLGSLLPAFLGAQQQYQGTLGQGAELRRQEEEDEQRRQQEEQQRRYTEALMEQMGFRRGEEERERREGDAQAKLRRAEHAEMLKELPPEEQQRLLLYVGTDKFPGLFYEATEGEPAAYDPATDPEVRKREYLHGKGLLWEPDAPRTGARPRPKNYEGEIDKLSKMYLQTLKAPGGNYVLPRDAEPGEDAVGYARRKAMEELGHPTMNRAMDEAVPPPAGRREPRQPRAEPPPDPSSRVRVQPAEVTAVRQALSTKTADQVRADLRRRKVPDAKIEELLRLAEGE